MPKVNAAGGTCMDEERRKKLLKELIAYDEVGVKFRLNGKSSDIDTIINACSIEEENHYMRDYIGNKKG
ncbi:MAG TPA: hypothetical protein IAC41_00745, partial [Candidatus Merdenecus merdavium]|nr:hypothetical protein [Candidatus Merdenecus merdavium]